LTMSYLKQYIITAADYGVSTFNYTRYWATSSSWRTVGRLVLGGNTLTTSGANKINIPFSVESDGLYDFWLRIAFAPNRGELRFVVDHALEGKIRPLANYWSKLQWVRITSLDLKKGNHVITLRNDGAGYNDIDSIAVVKSITFQTQMDEVLDTLKRYRGRVVNVLEAESAFTSDITSGWFLASSPYNDFVLRTEGSGRNISPLGVASASSVESNAVKIQGANDGDINTRWASSKDLPQWLQIEWATTQELSEVRIFFERAYAQDYLIQSWNGTDWIDQIDVKGNTLLQRLHEFQYPIETTKLRINVTYAPDFNMVSIWELEVCSPRAASSSTKIFIPREANYVLAARLSSGPEYGILDIGMNGFTTSINCSSSNTGFNWFELEPVFLETGEQIISISSVGKVDVDEIILYSL
ncbi:discoidin domain-containing protein, partial [Candidatus Bathyarchaeota archaeon]|nr:discoidin domain-containing protein [Candidatus Bathyarchaeota archaeon]